MRMPTGYTDADWGNNEVDCKSVSGIVFFFCGGPIAWTAKFQKCMAISTTEAELMAISEVTHQALYTQKLFRPLQLNDSSPIIIYNDNQGALKILESTAPPYHG
jgi:hypothetical protein